MAWSSALDRAVGAQLPPERHGAYFNTALISPLPRLTHDVMVATVNAELGEPRVSYDGYLDLKRRAADLRAALAGLVGAAPSEIALTKGATEGMNIVIWGIDWKPGDVVVTTNVEHGSALVALYHLRHRYGVRLEFADASSGEPDRTLAAMAAAIRPGVRLVLLSHVAFHSGAVLPVREIAALAHRAGAIVLLDGAQSVGAMPVDVSALGVDCCAFSGQKWLCGPEGTGALYLSTAAMERIRPTYLADGHPYEPEDPDSLALPQDASRFEQGAFSRAAIRGFGASVAWLSATIGMVSVYERTRVLREHCAVRVAELPCARLAAPADQLASLVGFRLAGVDAVRCVTQLLAQGVTLRVVPDGTLRFSVAFFNTIEAIDRAVRLIDAASRRI